MKEWWQLGHLFGLWVFKLSSGYGERHLWTLFWVLAWFLAPALLYKLFSPLPGWQALYYSAASLVAFINPLEVEIPRWLGTVALVQVYAGYFTLALLVGVLLNKMGHR